jgi:hypothetical protein
MVSPEEPSRGSRPVGAVAVAFPVPARSQRSWVPPRLRDHGDLRGLTLGPSPGLGESGNPATFRVSTTP